MLLIAQFSQYFFGFSIAITSVFLVMLVLVQRGRGGGLTGALGGAGGQSAFGTKAGDLFTRITVAVAAIWITLCAAAVFFLKDRALPDTGVQSRNTPTIESTVDPADNATGSINAGSAPTVPTTGSQTTGSATASTPTTGTPATGTPATDSPTKAKSTSGSEPKVENTTTPAE